MVCANLVANTYFMIEHTTTMSSALHRCGTKINYVLSNKSRSTTLIFVTRKLRQINSD